MKRFLLAIGLAAAPLTLLPSAAQAQFGYGGLAQQRLAQQAVIRWFQGYLGRLPNGQELAMLTNQYLFSGNALYVQSIILASNEFWLRSGGTPLGFLNRLFVTTIGRQPTLQEASLLQAQIFQFGRLNFVQAYLSNIAGGWQLNNWNRAIAAVPVPIVVPIVIR